MPHEEGVDTGITRIERVFVRENGSQAKIVAQAMFGAGLHCSIDVTVFRRDSENEAWRLCSKNPMPGWKQMPREQYLREGRPEHLQVVSHGEILKVASFIGKPLSSVKPDA